MKRCPITYEIIPSDQNYSRDGLKLLSPQLKDLQPLEYSANELRQEAIARVGKMSIQGIQPKLSAQLRISQSKFDIVDQLGHYILKPQSEIYPELPENEAITMTLAKICGFEVPPHGLIYTIDNSFTYFVKRFDRVSHNKKIPLEDFAQLLGANRDTKYASSMENVILVINNYCSFPKIEFVKLLRLTLFNFLVGNEDMHLKNFSLITRNNKILLSPAYDLLNTTIVLKGSAEELALPLNGKKNNLRNKDFLDYFAQERLGLNKGIISDVMDGLAKKIPLCKAYINDSFLTHKMKNAYLELLEERAKRLRIS